ncbi:uncharacterized protein LOC100831971 [Brachypodium distachyon]|uniref:PHD-type zinc finger plants domain-containing protein n=1 Tax=Brachypodium distachyon TaxID=15368 RepID=I1IAS2_BRADI|nr:uncharacterized protein LOC100831971 [Brachypodium distachyon]KQJ99985.1 hypothetical protein BRADI_3g46490v3 [Brachypodium distachyon]|eukprot:XP_003575200.1 uncharacterized protein LOC100831971 [Brachypodium distachyon]
MVSPGSDDAAAAVCCMCGDHGLPQELFLCKLCRLRLQHRYCSELYPRAATYRRCNWCIREDGGLGSPTKRRMSTTTSSEMNISKCDKRIRRSSGTACSRSVFSTDHSGKPVKKPKDIGDDGVMLPVPEAETTTAKGSKPQAAAGKKARFRVKVRRYKLLAEVISC